MEAMTDWITRVIDTLAEELSIGAELVPGLLGGLAILFVGWLIARGVRRAIRRVAEGSNRLLGRFFPSGRLAGLRISTRVAALLGEIGFFSILLLALTAAARVGGLSTLSGWLDRVAIYLPNLIAAAAIVLVGYLVGFYVREQVVRSSKGADDAAQRTTAGYLAQGATLAVALIMALDQLGIDVTLLIGLTVIGAAAVAITLGVSIALGARGYMSNLMGIRAARGRLSNGLTIRVNGVAGEILEVTNSQVILETDEGTALLPGQVLSEHVTVIVAPEREGGRSDG